MSEFNLESQIVGVPDKPVAPPVPEFKYLEVEVTRTQGTVLYLKVPKNFETKKLNNKILVDACKGTLAEYEWDEEGWEGTIERQATKEVSENEATAYNVYEVKV